MIFKYGCDSHEEFVEGILKDLEDEDLQPLRILSNLNSNEKIIVHLTNLWMKAARHGTDEIRLEVHKLQFHFVMYSVGPLLNYLTDEEWENTEEEWNKILANLRSFNGSFLGWYYERALINSQTADFYNLIAWIVGLYSMFGANPYSKLRPRIIQDQQGQEFIESNKSMTILHMNMMEFFIRHQIVDEQDELLTFINKGLNLVKEFPGGSWENYFSNLNEPPQPPSFFLS
jgi:hypothetical protein